MAITIFAYILWLLHFCSTNTHVPLCTSQKWNYEHADGCIRDAGFIGPLLWNRIGRATVTRS